MPKWYSYAIGSAVGVNRMLMMLGLIKPQLNEQTDDISVRQVRLANTTLSDRCFILVVDFALFSTLYRNI